MSRSIKSGDRVTLYWAVNWEGDTQEETLEGVVLSMPADVGDLLYVEDEKGGIHGINPSCATFERIMKQPRQAAVTKSREEMNNE